MRSVFFQPRKMSGRGGFSRGSGGWGGGGGGGGRGGGGGGGGRFQKSDPNAPRISSEVQIFVEGLPLDAKIPDLVAFFGTAGKVKSDRLTKQPRVWLYHDKSTGQGSMLCIPVSAETLLKNIFRHLFHLYTHNNNAN
jgi:hypothetical protein